MPPGGNTLQKWLCEQFASLLVSILETMVGERPEVHWEAVPSVPSDTNLCWKQPFSGMEGAVWITAGEAAWSAAGGHVLEAAGIQDGDTASLKSTFLEITGQALSGLAQVLATRTGREVLQTGGEETTAAPASEAFWMAVHLKLGATMVTLEIGFETALQLSILGDANSRPEVAHHEAEPPLPAGVGNSKTFELLLEVELPVSVSFGRAQILLKDVLKLTTGSIVELNRSVAEPVEVIVNNCVIARGEVVVVEGNFGVRIQQVISRQERLRTLN